MTSAETLQSHISVLCQSERVPHSTGYKIAQEYIQDQIQSLGHPVYTQDFHDFKVGKCRNIFTETGPGQGKRLLIGAHYESKASSGVAADDNASAVAISLELLKNISPSIPASFVYFDIEENFGWGGLHGSKAFQKFYKKEVMGVIIFDLVGGNLAPGFEPIYFQFGNFLTPLHHPALQFYQFPMLFLEPLGKHGARSDYDRFRRHHIPYTFFSSGTPWYYHTPNDTPEILNFSKMSLFTEALLNRLNDPLPVESAGEIKSWDDFLKFISKLSAQPILQTRLLSKLKKKKRPPNRIEILRMYSQLLPRLKKAGNELWTTAS